MENKIGQLFFINVDGFGTPKDQRPAVSKAYFDLAKEIQAGGVLPHYGNQDYQKVKAANDRFRKLLNPPPLIGLDWIGVQSFLKDQKFKDNMAGMGPADHATQFCAQQSLSCFGNLALINAFIHRAYGITQALGPSVELKNKLDPSRANPCIDALIDSFTKMDVAMTTHLLNPEVDPKDPATFSSTWVSKLRKEVGFQGLIMSDGMFMYDRYPGSIKLMAARWSSQENPPITNASSILTARAILAGHDLVILEGEASQTRQVFTDLHFLSCQDTENAKAFRTRVRESYDRILRFKEQHKATLSRQEQFPTELVGRAAKAFSDYQYAALWGDRHTPDLAGYTPPQDYLNCEKSPEMQKLIADILQAVSSTSAAQPCAQCSLSQQNSVPAPVQRISDPLEKLKE